MLPVVRKPAALVEDHLPLSRGPAFALLGLGDRRNEFGTPAKFENLLRRLAVGVQLPAPSDEMDARTGSLKQGGQKTDSTLVLLGSHFLRRTSYLVRRASSSGLSCTIHLCIRH